MEESEDNMSAEDIKPDISLLEKPKPKKRSIIERELETNLTARVTSPITNAEASSTSRYGRARKLKIDPNIIDVEKFVPKIEKSPSFEKTPVRNQSPVYRMHASNSPIRCESFKVTPVVLIENNLDNQIENIYHENISLSRFGSEEKKITPNKIPKVYVRKDLIQTREEEETITLIKNLFSPSNGGGKSNSHVNNILERSSEKYVLNTSHSEMQNGYASVVKTLDFDSNKKKKKEHKDGKTMSKSELFEMEAKCEYQVGDLAWSRMGTYPFWPCIVTREPFNGMFVKKKLFGRIERDIIHVTFFGDNGRRGWIVDTMLRKFHGQLEFEATREQFTAADKKKDPRLYAAFFVSEKKQPQWNISVEEAESLFREPKRLRIDILNEMLMNNRAVKTTPKNNKSGKITRTGSDVSLSESLYDTLFSEDDGKDDSDRSRNKSRNKSLDVSEVVTACLDNMAAKTGNIKIQRQSHMDRWLQKAKSKTPEKSHRLQIVPLKVEKKETKVSGAKKSKKSPKPSIPLSEKPYSFRRSANESQKILSNIEPDCNPNLEFAPSLNSTLNKIGNDSCDDVMNIDELQNGIVVIAKVENLSDSAPESEINNDNEGSVDSAVTVETNKSATENSNSKIHMASEVHNDRKFSDKLVSESVSSYSEIDSEIMTNNTNSLDSNNMDISSIEENVNQDVNEIKRHFLVKDTKQKPVTCELSHELLNLTNGGIDDHNETEMSSKDYNLKKLEPTTNSVNKDSQDEDVKNVFQSSGVSKHVCRDPQFKTYLELRQDDLIDQNPELSKDEIVEYLHKTWLYEENRTECDGRNDDYNQPSSVKKSNTKSNKKKQPQRSRWKKNNKSFEPNEHSDENIKLEETEESTELSEMITNSSNEMNHSEDLLNTDNDLLIDVEKESKTDIVTDLDSIHSICNKKSNETIEMDISENLPNSIDIKKESMADIIKDSDDIHNISSKISNETIENKLSDDSNVYNHLPRLSKVNDIDLDEINKNKTFNENISCGQDSKDDKIVVTTSESVKDTLHDDDKLCENGKLVSKVFSSEGDSDRREIRERNEHGNLDEHNLHRQEKYETKAVYSISSDDLFSNNKPVEVGVNEQSDVEIIANKEQNDLKSETVLNFSSIPQDKYDDDSSCDSIDISYAISPLSVKGDDADDPNIEDLNNVTDNIESNVTQTNDIEKNTTINGIIDSNFTIIKQAANVTDMSNKAGPKENIVSNESTIHDQPKTETLPNKETAASIEHSEVNKNGTHVSKSVEDFEGDNLSVHSEDSEPLSVTKNKIRLKRKERVNKFADPEFVTYLEMRQDDIADEHPELNEDEIVEYLYKTWLYEEDSKSDIQKTDDIVQSNLIKGLGESKSATKKRKTRETKEKKVDNETCDVETASLKSEESTSIKRWLRPKKYTSKLYADFDSSRDSSPVITDETTDTFSVDSEEYRTNNSTPSDEISKPIKRTNSKLSLKIRPLTLKSTNTEVSKPIDLQNGDVKIDLIKASIPEMVNGFNEAEVIAEVKEEFDLDTVSVKSEDSEKSLSKRKQKIKFDRNIDDPEFAKYLELRQDALIDENPQLTHEEVVSYMYKTWLYEESVKSDLKKSDEIEQSNLVRGINQDIVMPKRVKKKVKVEDDIDEPMQTKPKRKIMQQCYNEDYPDLEDEIAIFEIMKNSPTVEMNKLDLKEKSKEVKGKKETTEEQSVIEIEEVVDEVELYFQELSKPKPNVFKGLLREKVCEICEKVGSLIKCKSCNGMFHLDCVKHETESVETKASVPSRGRKKKKKKPGRRPKNLEDSGSMSDEKSQDVSAENMSTEDIIEPESRTVDAENFETQLSAKMKELLESTEKEIHYDSYSSDDGIDWDNSIAGKCEIVDIILKPKSQNTDFKCNNCQKYDTPVCFVCKMAASKTGVEYRQRCQVTHCNKYYHLECLDHWPQTQFTSSESRNKKTNEVFESHMCPRHVCHTCVCDDPRGCKTRFSGDKLARCVRCPATYHSFTKCLPAGTQILTGSHIICPRHYEHRPGKVPCHVNTGWCFICALGGTLICCEYCPTSFHAECLNISPPEGNYMCEDCETGRLPLYGEMVWVKLGHYRWWPGLILHPTEIPDNIMAVKHSPGEFVVRFFGQYDHYWVNRGRVFPFQEGDSGKISSQKSKIDAAFTTAMEHAQRACQILKKAQENEEESLDIASSLLPPHYVKLKVNKPYGSLVNRKVEIEESSLTQCDCDPNDSDPCGPYTQCLNRMLLTECGPICRAGDRCNNRAFEKRLYPKLVPYRTPHRGWGLKTLEDIKAGQFVIEYVGELIDEEEFRRRMARKHEIRDENFYFLTLDKERMIDAGPKGNLARFMNHSCEPNCETQKWTVLGDVRVGLFAVGDIAANSEVTFNYLLECAGIDKKKCMCGAKRCAGYIGAKPKQDESQPKKNKIAAKRTYKKRKNTEESPSTKCKPKRPVGRPAKPKELTEIEKDLLIIKSATNGLSSDSECNSRLSSVEGDRNSKALKRKRVSFSSEDIVLNYPSVKKVKLDVEKGDFD
ncbi:uncharacterized protein LOC128680356 [Plodia interpunctella]|uniref:uncharacterized protein LOC128680356 n=2 Tax=Plodia interpunctella TaxID=58824 RepID=UPI002368CF7A|nr:uncharacterized protein LOC128680356 [Plodia interpunctella]